MSAQVMGILTQLTPAIEIYSIDEAFLDLSGFSHMNTINKRYGKETVKLAATGKKPQWTTLSESRSPGHTTDWADFPVVRAKNEPLSLRPFLDRYQVWHSHGLDQDLCRQVILLYRSLLDSIDFQ